MGDAGPGGVQQTIELDELYEETGGGGGRAVALIRRVALG